jgi:hypothetical protein
MVERVFRAGRVWGLGRGVTLREDQFENSLTSLSVYADFVRLQFHETSSSLDGQSSRHETLI